MIRDVYPGSRMKKAPDPNSELTKNLSIFNNKKSVTKLS